MSYNKEKVRLRRRGWTAEAWEAERAATGDHCRLCGAHSSRPNADHCHATHTPRGLLYHTCNLRLGHVERYLYSLSVGSRFTNHESISARWYRENQEAIDRYLSGVR